MGKKSRASRAGQAPEKTIKARGAEGDPQPITRSGWLVIGAGAGCVFLGFLALTRVDALALNAWSVVSPALILAGYGLVALGLWLAPSREGGENPSSLPPAAR